MVDFRPLLFINALAIMLLVTAGFASVREPVDAQHLAAASELLAPSDVVVTLPANRPESEPPAPEPGPFKTSDLADELPKTSANGKTSPPTLGSRGDAAPPAETVSPDAREPGHFQIAMAEPAFSRPEPEPAPTPASPTTGNLTLRSNVVDDRVLINGETRGPTRLDLKLQPGSYDVEISKQGFKPWRQTINIDAGDDLTLIGRLEAYTRVEYRAGDWIGGVRTGDGTYEGSDGLRYEGGFVNGEFNGKGTVWYPEGGRYDGDWQHGAREGEGTFRGADGSTYTGQFKNDQFNGQGTLTRANGDIRTGLWADNRLNGHGSLTSSDGMLFVGGFRNDRFHGEGSLTYPDGRSYEGEFSNGEFHGSGSEVLVSGKKYQGEYLEGKFHGKGLLLNPNGSSIQATFRHGEPYGQVVLTTPQGEIFNARTSEPGVCYRDNSYRATQCPPLEGW
ncbi:MORN repeat-containing protein [Marinobacter caseinilyticus]|uniref:MORN repeat-containing protein n=1 Tax=Marinobacter caseinilyticus TaxID=2692195 RepID=UPI00140A8959|nr:PEGA domain-containing protein [Marinobacter caseinilyticus]